MYNIEDTVFELFDDNFIDINYEKGNFYFESHIDYEDALDILDKNNISYTKDDNTLIISLNSLNESLGDDYSNIELIDNFEFENQMKNGLPGIYPLNKFINALNNIGKDKFKCRTTRFGKNISLADIQDENFSLDRNGWTIFRDWDTSLKGFDEVYICIKNNAITETYTDDELDKLQKKTFNQQKILNIYRRKKYRDSRLFAHTRCTNCGREKKVFLSNLVSDPDKYGSCICSDTNIESKLDTINGLYKGNKKLSSNTSGYTGVYFVSKYRGEAYNKWRAYIEIDGKRTYLGDFTSKGKAIKARKKAAQKGIKWYKEHKNDFMKANRRRKNKYRKNHKTN